MAVVVPVGTGSGFRGVVSSAVAATVPGLLQVAGRDADFFRLRSPTMQAYRDVIASLTNGRCVPYEAFFDQLLALLSPGVCAVDGAAANVLRRGPLLAVLPGVCGPSPPMRVCARGRSVACAVTGAASVCRARGRSVACAVTGAASVCREPPGCGRQRPADGADCAVRWLDDGQVHGGLLCVRHQQRRPD